MKAYLQLVNFEINRFAKLYIWLAVIIFLIQLATTVIVSEVFIRRVAGMMRDGAGQAEVSEMLGSLSLSGVTISFGFFLPILLGIAALLFYMFFIWYRDWFAKSTFIYRLLTLPTARMNIFFAKITTIMLSVFGLVSLQLINLKLCSYIVTWIVPVSFRGSTSVVDAAYTSSYLNIFYPGGFPEFLIAYGTGFSFVVVVFTMIILERSFRMKGLILGGIYAAVCLFVCLIPYITQVAFNLPLYEEEFFFMEVMMVVIVTVVSLIFSRYLLNHKIAV